MAGSFPASASQHGRWPPLPAPRYNDFLHDPLSLCRSCRPQPNGENAISARSDLNPANGSYPFQALSQRSHGGIDVKVRATPPPPPPGPVGGRGQCPQGSRMAGQGLNGAAAGVQVRVGARAPWVGSAWSPARAATQQAALPWPPGD